MTIKKSGIFFLLWLLLSALFGCAPMQTYEELEAEAKITGDTTKLDKRDRQVERATAYYQNRADCKASNLIWTCGGGGKPSGDAPRGESIDEFLRRYSRDRFAGCGCSTPADVRESIRRMGL